MQPFRRDTCGSGCVYPLALVSGSSGVRGQEVCDAYASESTVSCAVRQKMHTNRCTWQKHRGTCTHMLGSNYHYEYENKNAAVIY